MHGAAVIPDDEIAGLLPRNGTEELRLCRELHELADRIGVEQPTLGRVLRDLEAEGLIERMAGSADRRAKVIRLTAAAKPVMKQINRIQESVRARLLNGIEPKDLAICMAVFALILANFDKR